MKTTTRRKPGSLGIGEHYCVLVASLFAVGKRDEAAVLVEHGLEKDFIPERLFRELYLHLSLLLGFPSMLDGLSRLRDVSGHPSGVRPTARERDGDVVRRGNKTLRRIYGKATDRLLANLASLHEIVPSVVVRDAYGRIISRRGMSLREREIVNVVVLSIQKLDRQLYSHLRGALRVGVPPRGLRQAINLGSRAARTSQDTALKMLSSLLAAGRLRR